MTDVHDRVPVGDAGAISFVLGPDGVRLVDVESTPGWHAEVHRPKGFLRRRRATDWLAASWRTADDERHWEFELSAQAASSGPAGGRANAAGGGGRPGELGLSADGVWEAAVLRAWRGEPTEAVSTAGGWVRCRVVDGRLEVDDVDAQPGWSVRSEAHDGDEVVVILSRGDGEEHEVQVLLGDPGQRAHLEHDHRWPYRRG